MFDIDKWTEIFQTLAKNPLRTFLTALGVGWGIFMLVIMLGVARGLENGVHKDYTGLATNSFFMWSRSTTMPYKGLSPGRSFNMKNGDDEAIRQNVQEAGLVCPRNRLGGWRGGSTATRGINTGTFTIMGDYPVIREVEPIDLFEGRFLNDFDIEDKRKVAVIGSRVQAILFDKDEDPIGAYIRVNGVYFKVVGIFRSKNGGDRGERTESTIYLPFTTFQKAYNYGDVIGFFAITSKKGISASIVEDKVVAYMKKRHKVHPDDDRAFGHWNMEKQFNQIQGLFLGFDVLIWIIGIGTLMAGIIGVTNIMLIIVKERTKEFGIRRAIGAKPLSITSQVIAESIILTTLAGFSGMIFGTALVEISKEFIQNDMYLNPLVQFESATWSLVILILAGALAGFLPAVRAVSIKPVDALRAE